MYVSVFCADLERVWEAQKCENSGKLVILEAGGAGRVRIGMGSLSKTF